MKPNMKQQIDAKKKAKRQQEDAILNRVLIWFGCAVVIEIVLLLINRFVPGISLVRGLSVLVPAVAVLAMVYYLYQRDFFLSTLISAGGILSLQLYRRLVFLHPFRIKCGFALAYICLAAAVVVLILLQRKGGWMTIQGKKRQILPKDANYVLMYLTCVLNAVLLTVTLSQINGVACGANTAYYLLFVLAAWLFVMAVYYTVKLI